MVDTTVFVFAKLPLPGLVKTRLARSVGAGAASRFYSACAEHIIRQAAKRCVSYAFACHIIGLRHSFARVLAQRNTTWTPRACVFTSKPEETN